ncbi:MAG: type pilus assembly protein PilY1 [Thauera sp.]|nr:PilC/PilY family type IV pilus protein [Thauera sp.]MDI3491372.1 type pilus assembly protein PilY1 [Thauera sp.]
MKTKILVRALRLALVLPALWIGSSHAGPLALPDTPLTVSASVEPNVMLLIDNSGSMEHIIWHEDYDPNTTYRAWRYISGGDYNLLNLNSDYRPSNFGRGDCSSGFKKFRLGTTSTYKCLKLPEPNGASNTRYESNYVRFLLDRFASGTDLTAGQIPNEYRMQVARDVAKDLITNTPGVRFGVTRFNNNEGGKVVGNCGATSTSLISTINGLTAENWTPLAETYYEVTRYFRGLSSYYNSSTSYTSPIQYRCQKNFTIVLTDGLPTYDAGYPNNDPDDVADSTRALPNWDGVDNDGPHVDQSNEGDRLYLDDIAKFAWDIDFKKTGTDLAGGSYNDPKYSKQNMYTYTVGFTVANQMLEDAASYGNGLYLTANNATQLTDVLARAMSDIQGKLGASSSAAASGGYITAGTKVYQGRLNSENWTGQLLAFGVDTDTASPTYGGILTTGSGPDGALWDAGALISPSTRSIITNTSSGIPFTWTSFTPAEQSTYFSSASNLLDYLRGANVAGYRTRTSLLGDIVNSAPQYVAAPSARYLDSLETVAYSTFKAAQASRTPMIYVGANDGMLHAFNAETGAEQLAYIPGAVLPRLKHLSSTDYQDNHKFYVDGTPTVADAFVNSAWKTMLVGGLNKGGQSIYALDVTNPGGFSEGNASSIFRWEFTDADDADLGYTYSRPAIVKLNDGRWAAVFGNGYNNTTPDDYVSTTGNAVLYIVDLWTGELIKKISTNVGTAQDPAGRGRPNGLATVSPVDLQDDGTTDYIYAGDLFGNMWKFDLSSSNPTQWKRDYKLFDACAAVTCNLDNQRAITTRPTVIRHPEGVGRIVLFGTGKYIEVIDNGSGSGGRQSFYGIWDTDPSSSATVTLSQLQKQEILIEQILSVTDSDGNTFSEPLRVTTNHRVDWKTKKGWYMDLGLSTGPLEGERQVTNSIVRNGRLIFTTMIPSDSVDPCAPAGTSWIMELDAATGARLTYSPFDLNRDLSFTRTDFVRVTIGGDTVNVPASGRKTEGGHAQTPSVVSGEGAEFKYISTSEGLETIVENPGTGMIGRQSWRELYRERN